MKTVIALVCVAILASASAASAATWRRLRTDNFIFIGDASEGQIREIAQELEKFRALMMLALPNATAVSPVPTVVAVFSTDRAFQPYQPRFEGRRVEVAGFFQSGEDVNYLAINGELGGPAVGTVLHEYTHFLVGNTLGVIPLWLSEGLAEFYETMVESQGGKAAILGIAPSVHVDLLRASTLIPLSELLSVERNSPMYNEGSRRGVFYAQSWALTHYLSLGNRQRVAQFQTYLSLVRQSGAPDQALRSAFGVEPSVLESELRKYVNNFSFPAMQMTFSDKITIRITTRAEVIPEPEAQGYLGDMIGRLGRVEDARELLDKAITANAKAARPTAALGMLDLRASRVDDAIRRLETATSLSPDDAMISAALGRALVERVSSQATDLAARTEILQRARAALDRAATIEPDTAQTAALLGYVEMALDQNSTRAISLLERAANLAPARENYRFMLADALLASGNYEAATRQFGQLVARGSTPEVREEAREGLARVARMRMPNDTAGATPPTPAGKAGTPALRSVGPGETRVLGMFQAIECSAAGALLVVETSERTMRFAAGQLSDVQLVTFRDDTPAGINCGVFASSFRALVTYTGAQPPGGTDGVAIAVELIPDGFNP